MLRYRILNKEKDNQISISLSKTNADIKNISDEEFYENIINENLDYEKEIYTCKLNYMINFYFYDLALSKYSTDFNNAGFNLPSDLNKQSFNKSLFLFEFYDNLEYKNMKFTTTLSVYPNVLGNKGPVFEINNGNKVLKSIYNINSKKNEGYYLYYKRNLSAPYEKMYVKVMFLNAKTGKTQYFINNSDISSTIQPNNFNENMFYHEIRFYNDYTFSFIRENYEVTQVNFKEVVIK